jgi:L-asparaginase II
MIPEVLVNVMRSGIVESRHRGHLVAVDAKGQVIYSLGDPKAVTFWRSAAKPLQALPLVEEGGIEFFGLTAQELAVICSSHGGETEHIQAVASILRKIGLTEDALECGPAAPMNGSAARNLLRNNKPFLPVHNPCSGKHSGMLALCILKGWPVKGYYQVGHPVQQTILKTISQTTYYKQDDIKLGIDGCGVPVYCLPILNMAMAFSSLAQPPETTGAGRKSALQQICDAMTSYPFFVAGTNRLDTILMEVTEGRLVAKLGSESVYCVGLKNNGMALCLKIEDGGYRALAPAVIQALARLGWLTEEEVKQIRSKMRLTITNHRGEAIGSLEASAAFYK